MTNAQTTQPKTMDNPPPDRLSHALDFANELNESRLWKIKISYQKRWTRHRKTRQSVRIRLQKPWRRSTGPKTAQGKAITSRNALTGDHIDRAFFIPALQANARFLSAVNLFVSLKRRGGPVPPACNDRLVTMGLDAATRLLTALFIAHEQQT